MSKVKTNSIESLNGLNTVTTEDVKKAVDNAADKTKFSDWYESGDIFTSTKNLSDTEFLKLKGTTVISELNAEQAFQKYDEDGLLTKESSLIPKSIQAFSETIQVPFLDNAYIEMEVFGGTPQIKTLDINGEQISSESIGDSPDLFSGEKIISYDNRYIPSTNETITVYQINSDLYCWIYDGDLNSVSFDKKIGFLQNGGKIKITTKYIYEITETQITRYNLPLNGVLQTSGETLVTKNQLETEGFFNPFVSVTVSDYYGWSEDFQILTFDDPLKKDILVFIDVDIRTNINDNVFYLYTIDIPDDLTSFDLLNVIEVSGISSGSSLRFAAQNSSFKYCITQNSEEDFFLYSLSTGNSNNTYITDSTNERLFGGISAFRIDLETRSNTEVFDVISNLPKLFDIFGPAANDLFFEIYSFNKNSISLLLFEEDRIESNTYFYKDSNYIMTINFNPVEFSTIENKDIVVQQLKDDQGNNVFVCKSTNINASFPNVKIANYYNNLNCRAEAKTFKDGFFTSFFIYESPDGFNSVRLMNNMYSGYIFEPLSNQKNVITYIKK